MGDTEVTALPPRRVKVIRESCIDCSGDSLAEVRYCRG
jgi:hypothetical protein